MKNLLVLARRFNPDCPQYTGGVIVLSENLLKYLDENKIKYDVVDTNKSIYRNRFFALILIVYLAVKKLKNSTHVAMNLNENELILIAPILVFCAKIFGTSCSLRVFGGNVNIFHRKSVVHRILLDYVLRKVDVTFLETDYLVSYFSSTKNTIKLPNCRYSAEKGKFNTYNRKFVFISHIKKEKGVSEILQALEILGEEYSVDFFGSLIDYDESELNTRNSTYKGLLDSNNVAHTLKDYNCLLLPTYHKGEGYPGIILEAYSVGVPVIATRWRSIPEIVEDGKSGLLVEPRCVESLVKAIKSINAEIYRDMTACAKNKFDEFNCECVYARYIAEIEKCK